MIQVRANLDSVMTYTLTWEDLNLVEDGVYIGIISFAGNATDLTNGKPILFDSAGKNSLISKINNNYTISGQPGTALFYGVHQALANLTKITTYPDKLDSVNVITFTDGLDNGSTGMNILIEGEEFTAADAYAAYVKAEIDHDRIIDGKPITAYSIGVKGNDVTDEEKFESNLKQIASDGNDSKFVEDEWDEVKKTFAEIAGKLNVVNSNTNFDLTTTRLETNTKVRMTFETNEAPNAEVDSTRFIEGTVTATRTSAGMTFTLSDISYGDGLSSSDNKSLGSAQGAGPIDGTNGKKTDPVTGDEIEDPDSPEINFAFTGITGFDPAYDGAFDSVTKKPLHAKQWTMAPGKTEWQVNSEYTIGGATEKTVEKRSSLIYLVLDSSISMEETQISKVREAAIEFINLLYNRLNPSL
jgi:hypothetical protein